MAFWKKKNTSGERPYRQAEFDDALDKFLSNEKRMGKSYADVLSKDLHDSVFDPNRNKNHRMPMACNAMWKRTKVQRHEVMSDPDKPKTSTLLIRYYF